MKAAIDIAPMLDADLADCARSLDEAEAVLRQREQTAPTAAGRELARRDREAAAKLQAEPWFGWIDVDEGGRRSYRIGKAGFPALRIVEWRHPLGKVFFESAPGAEYERPAGGRALEGVLVAHGRVRLEARSLQHVIWTDAGGRSEAAREGASFVEAGAMRAPARAPQIGLPEIVSLLTPEQYRLIARSSDRPLIIQGQAGSGKTSVALHRLSWLAYPGEAAEAVELASAGRAVDPSRALIVMFNKALSTFARTSLEPLKLEAARLDTFHGWALETVRTAYKGVIEPRATSLPGKDVAHRLKAQLGILAAIDAFVVEQTKRLEAWLEEKLPAADRKVWLERYRAAEGAVVRRLITVRKAALDERDAAADDKKKQRLDGVYQVFRAAVTRTTLYKEELQRLLTDRALLRQHLTAGDDELDALVAYQSERQAERAPEGKRVGPYVDFDDLALILRLIQKKHGGLPNADESVSLYDHLVIDEVQDFGAVQLMVLLSAVESRTGVTIVGDVNQKILPDVEFMGWDALAKELGLGGVDVARLEIGHRSTLPIMRLANHVAGLETAGAARPGPTPQLVRCASSELAERVATYLRARAAEAPSAHLCVVCPRRTEVAKTLDSLRTELAGAAIAIREGHSASFEFGPGITVTNWQQVKGLEFDTVVVVEPVPDAYPDTEAGRRALYVVATRAQEQLVFFAGGEITPLLESAIEAGVVEEQVEAAPVTLGSEDEPL